jgi:uncharacterized membrane protein
MTVVILALLGGVVGGALLSDFGGFVFGVVVGGLVGWVADLAGRVRMLERRLEARKTAEARAPDVEAAPPVARPVAAPVPVALRADEPPPDAPAAAAPRTTVRQPRAPSPLDALVANVWRWFSTGNVPVKVGVVLSLFGVGFLVKEGIDREWLVLPLEIRLVLVALFGIGLLALGWRLRTRQRIYALSIQGGGIGVLYLTIYASFAIYGLLPAALAFALLVVVTAATGVLAVLQDARALAVLGTLGGFLAPVLASTGSGNHVALFSYYALLNVGVVGIAWFKAWRVLNVLGFVFTFGIGALWGRDGFSADKFATTEPFLILFTLMYLVIPVLFATRSEPRLRGFVDGTLLFGTPIVAFALQSRLVAHLEYGLAISAVVLALLYVGMATFLYRSRNEKLRVLVEAQLALSVAFATVAVPLALDARWTSAAWALQGAALVWLAFRQQRKLALLAGLALQALSGVAYVEQSSVTAEWPILNGYYLGALVLAFAGLFSARLFDPARERRAVHPSVPEWLGKLLAIVLLVWAAGWWFAGGFMEVDRSVGSSAELAALLVFVAASALLAMHFALRVDWPRLNWAAVTLWPFGAVFAFGALLELAHPAEGFGWLAWPVVVGSMLWFLRAREELFPRLRGALHATAYWLVVGLVAWEAHWLVSRAAEGVWPVASSLALVAAMVLVTLHAAGAFAWPFAANARSYVRAGCGAVVAGLTLATFSWNVGSAGEASPLPYVPLVNPLELASVLVVFALLRWLAALGEQNPRLASLARARPAVAAAAAWFLVTMSVARTVHHWAGVPYDLDSLGASTIFQSALSIVWGVAGLAAMTVGARSRQRAVWLAGAALMAIVVAKLFIVDLGNTGTLARVVSFLGVGLLLLVVGYFAPVPPRIETEARAVS